MDALQVANFLKEAGPWAVSTILLVMLTLFVRGDILPSKVVENIISKTTAATQAQYEKLVAEYAARSTEEHRNILEAIHERRGVK